MKTLTAYSKIVDGESFTRIFRHNLDVGGYQVALIDASLTGIVKLTHDLWLVEIWFRGS